MSSPEFAKDQKVRIKETIREEYSGDKLVGEIGDVIGVIPPKSPTPNRVMVSLDGKGFVNIRPQDLEIIDPK